MLWDYLNIFRVFLDAGKVDAILKDLENGINADALRSVILDNLTTGIEILDNAIKRIKIKAKLIEHTKRKNWKSFSEWTF